MKCMICNRTFKTQEKLDAHKETHNKIRAFPCSTCGKRFKRKADKNRHEKIHYRHATVPVTQEKQALLGFQNDHGYASKPPIPLAERATKRRSSSVDARPNLPKLQRRNSFDGVVGEDEVERETSSSCI